MNKELWNKIDKYNLDLPIGEYGFSIRLANENFWTRNYTSKAIVEYKKFMYLAATSDKMVSPSEVIDKVWHQHLIFTQSYQDFCQILGKVIQHVPSTHNKADFYKFQEAKDRTEKLYTATFGEPPQDIWAFTGMFESLELEKSKFKLRTVIIIGLFLLAFLTIPAYFALRPLYLLIGNPHFILSYLTIVVTAFVGLEIYNTNYLNRVLNEIRPIAFVWQLDPFEVMFLKTGRVADVVNGHINKLLERKIIKIDKGDFRVEASHTETFTPEEYQITEALVSTGKIAYPILLRHLISKPIFSNTANCMNAFTKYFRKSKKFGTLFYLNFAVFGFIFLLGFIRLCMGLLRGKPVEILIVVLLIFTVCAVTALRRLSDRVFKGMIPARYLTSIVAREEVEQFEWQYVRDGKEVMSPAFVPLLTHLEKSNWDSGSSSSCGSSCASSCGSSCSSCGGCGGD